MSLALLMLIAAAPAAAQRHVTAEEALENYREVFKPTPILDCPPVDPDTITVCGRREATDPNRLPFPTEPEPGAPVRLLPGEAPRASTSAGGCLRLCPQPVTVNILTAVPSIVKGISKILDPDR